MYEYNSNYYFSNSLDASNYYMKVFIIDDNSGYYFIAVNQGSVTANLCKFLYSNPSTTECYVLSFFTSQVMGQTRISDDQFFLIGTGSSPSPNLHMLRVTFGSTSPNWDDKISCPNTSWQFVGAEAYFESSTNYIYSVFIYGSGTSYLQLVILSSTDGSVQGSRFISNISCSIIYGKSTIVNNLFCFSAIWTNSLIILFDTKSFSFTIKQFAGNFIGGCAKDNISGR